MIITRAPLRVTLGGGGTDLPSYYRKYGGQLIAGSIDKYVYIALHKIFPKEYIIKYSQYERVQSAAEVKHPIIREALVERGIEPSLEIISLADIPDGTGLGSSGSFTVALIKALAHYKREPIYNQALAEAACDIEINRLKQPIGKQDQYTAAFGGLTCYTFHKDDSVEVTPLHVSQETLQGLEDNTLLFFTGYSRSASDVLSDQKKKTESQDKEMLKNLHFTKDLGIASKKALEEGDLYKFGTLMHEHWENKRKRTEGISKSLIDRAYDVARDNGAIGGKLIGAGGGGFLMFYTDHPVQLRDAMAKENLEEVRFKFDFEGAKVLTV